MKLEYLEAKNKTLRISYGRGDSKMNELWKNFDLGSQGIYIFEEATLKLKPTVRVTEKYKQRVKDAWIKANKKVGFDIVEFKFI